MILHDFYSTKYRLSDKEQTILRSKFQECIKYLESIRNVSWYDFILLCIYIILSMYAQLQQSNGSRSRSSTSWSRRYNKSRRTKKLILGKMLKVQEIKM